MRKPIPRRVWGISEGWGFLSGVLRLLTATTWSHTWLECWLLQGYAEETHEVGSRRAVPVRWSGGGDCGAAGGAGAGRGGASQAEVPGRSKARGSPSRRPRAGLRLAGLRRRRSCGTGRAAPWRRRRLMLLRVFPRRRLRLRRHSQRPEARTVVRSECCRACGARSVSGGRGEGTHPAATAAAGLRGAAGARGWRRRDRGAERGLAGGREEGRHKRLEVGVCWGRRRSDGAAWTEAAPVRGICRGRGWGAGGGSAGAAPARGAWLWGAAWTRGRPGPGCGRGRGPGA